MTLRSSERNPFMLMLNPQAVIEAVEKSTRLAQLNRHLCRPLDRVPALTVEAEATAERPGREVAAGAATVAAAPVRQ